MGGLKSGHDLVAGDRTSLAVGLAYQSLEATLPQAGSNESKVAENGTGNSSRVSVLAIHRFDELGHRLDKPTHHRVSLRGIEGVALPLNNRFAEVCRGIHLKILGHDTNLIEQDASHFWVLARLDRSPAIFAHSLSHFLEGTDAITKAEDVPGFRNSQPDRPLEEAAADEAIAVVPFALEQKGFTSIENTKVSIAAGLPEVDFGDQRIRSQESPPITIGNTHVRLHEVDSTRVKEL